MDIQIDVTLKMDVPLSKIELSRLDCLFCNLDYDYQESVLDETKKDRDSGKEQHDVLATAQRYIWSAQAAKGLLKKYTLAKMIAISNADDSCEEVLLTMSLSTPERKIFRKQLQDWIDICEKDCSDHPTDGNDYDQMVNKLHTMEIEECESILEKFGQAERKAFVTPADSEEEQAEYIVDLTETQVSALELFLLEKRDECEKEMETLADKHQFPEIVFDNDEDLIELINDYRTTLDVAENLFVAKLSKTIRDAKPNGGQ